MNAAVTFPCRAFDDVVLGSAPPGSLRWLSFITPRAFGAPFRDFDERILLLKLLGDGFKPGMRVIENNLSFLLRALNENGLTICALIKRKLRNEHGRAGGKRTFVAAKIKIPTVSKLFTSRRPRNRNMLFPLPEVWLAGC